MKDDWTIPRPAPPRSVAGDVVGQMRLSGGLTAPPMPHSVAAAVSCRVRGDTLSGAEAALRSAARPALPRSVAPQAARRIAASARVNHAPHALVALGLLGSTLLVARFAAPNLQAAAAALETVGAGLSPLLPLGLTVALLCALAVSLAPGRAGALRAARLGYAFAAALLLPGVVGTLQGGGNVIRVGQDVVVSAPVAGNVVALGGTVRVLPGGAVGGDVIAFMGDVIGEGGRVSGQVTALLGEVSAPQARAVQTALPPLSLASASAFRPLLGWFGGGSWPWVYALSLGALMLLLHLLGLEGQLARRQRHAPLLTLSMGLLGGALLLPGALLLLLSGLLLPGMVLSLALVLGLSVGLAVTLHDLGRALVRRAIPGDRHPEGHGALLGWLLFAATLPLPPLAITVWLLGSVWGVGALLLSREQLLAAHLSGLRHRLA